jgi:hypothetical protein
VIEQPFGYIEVVAAGVRRILSASAGRDAGSPEIVGGTP